MSALIIAHSATDHMIDKEGGGGGVKTKTHTHQDRSVAQNQTNQNLVKAYVFRFQAALAQTPAFFKTPSRSTLMRAPKQARIQTKALCEEHNQGFLNCTARWLACVIQIAAARGGYWPTLISKA